MWQAGGDFQTKDGKSAFNSPAVVQALKFWQDAINTGVAPRKPLGGGAWDVGRQTSGSGYCAMQNVGIWAIAQLRKNAPGLQVRHLQAAHAHGRQIRHGRRRLGLCRQRQGQEPGSRRRVRRLGAWLDGRGFDPARSSTGARRPSATCRRRNRRSTQGKAAFNKGIPQDLHQRDLARRPRRAAACRRGLQDHLGRDPGRPANGRPRAAGGRRRGQPASTRSLPATRAPR